MILKKCICVLLTLVMCFSCVNLTSAATAGTGEEDRAMGYSMGGSVQTYGTVSNCPSKPSGATGIGIDVSHWDGTIDFSKLKNDVDFVIIRCGYGSNYTSQDDAKFKTYVQGCVKYNIPYGVYLYAHANTETKAKSEGAHAVRQLAKCASYGGEPTLPVYYDMEDDDQAGLSAANKAKYAKIFCDAVEAAGYESGVYANLNWWNNKLTNSYFTSMKNKWVAQWASKCTYKKSYNLWQCTSSGKVAGVSGKVDFNYSYFEIPDVNYNDASRQLKVTLNQSTYEYTGEAIIPDLTIEAAESAESTESTEATDPVALAEGTDYTVTCTSNIKTGKATVTVTGCGDYEGTWSKAFYIVPQQVTTLTSKKGSKKKSAVLKWTKVTGATGYQIAYKRSTTTTAYKSYKYTTGASKTFTKLKVKNYTVKIRAYKTVSGTKHYGAWSDEIVMTRK